MSAQNLPEERLSAEYVFEFDHCEDMRQAVYEAVGAASVCWESMEGTGIFDVTRASAIADALLQYIEAHK